jgi:outer membrane protein
MKQVALLVGLLLLIIFSVNGQNSTPAWDLARCLNYAMENNLQLKQQALNADVRENELKQSQFDLGPNLNANSSYGISMGRALDESTYSFTEDQNIQSANFSVSSSLTLFQGFQKMNTIQRNRWELSLSKAQLELLKNNISLNIVSAYLQILFNKELVITSEHQLDLIEQQVGRTEKLVRAGSAPKGTLLEMQAQMASEELRLINAQNQLETSLVNLKQLLDLETDTVFDVVSPEINVQESSLLTGVEQVYSTAENEMPQVKAAEFALKSANEGLQLAKGGRSPILNLNFYYSTRYSDARDKLVGVTPENTPIYADYPFVDQLEDNMQTNVSLGLSIPIFNGWQVGKNINNAKIQLQSSQYQLEREKQALYKEIQQAFVDARSALKRFQAAVKSVDSQKESFRYKEQQFEVGLINTVEYNDAKNKLINAESELLQAKYEYIFKTRILDFYQGKPITL